MKIWPAVQIRSGKCVRLSQGDYRKETVYGESPADMAIRWVNDGAQSLHVADLDGARDGSTENFDSICEIIDQANVPIQLGGGIRDETTIKKYLAVGVERLVVGTRALKDPQWAIEMAQKYPGRIMLGLDSRQGMLASDGWVETTDIPVVEFAKRMSAFPIAGIIFKDIAKDGMMGGPNFAAQKQLRDAVDVPVIASGGIAKADDVSKLAALNVNGCVIGRALYEGRLTLADSLNAAEAASSKNRTSLGDQVDPPQSALKGPHGRSMNKTFGASTP